MLGVRPRAKILAQCVIGGDIEFMLDGPVDAANIVLGRTGLTIDDIDLFEVNEAFASVPMSFAQVHGVDPELLNVNGGAIALGPPGRCNRNQTVGQCHRRTGAPGQVHRADRDLRVRRNHLPDSRTHLTRTED